MLMHFEELWEKCEKLHQDVLHAKESSEIVKELGMKIALYKAIVENAGSENSEELQKIKSRALGEILLTLTHLSYKDNINVFEALGAALQYRSIEHYAEKHQTGFSSTK